MADKFVLKVTAGPTNDTSEHKDVLVNTSTPVQISTSQISASINVRIRDYRGLPEGSPWSCEYFENDPHKHDRISIAFSFKLKEGLTGDELVFGNDFDHPIRDRLPWGFSTAFSFIKSWIDPGLYGDPYADEPYLYGPLLSSINVFRVGSKDDELKGANTYGHLTEGAQEGGVSRREESGMPADAAGRKKYFLQEAHRKQFKFDQDRVYHCDFFNPYLDFNDFTLKLPVITIPVISHWDGQPLRSHSLRYVLKSRNAETPLLVILFSLIPLEELDADSDAEPAAEKSTEDSKAPEKSSAVVEADDID